MYLYDTCFPEKTAQNEKDKANVTPDMAYNV